jgi:hypothetical protein
MKTLRLALVAAILSFALISYAGIKPGQNQSKKVVKISLKLALTEPGLVRAMHAQLKISFLKIDQQGQYVGTVFYHQVVYKIYGTRTEWIRFFISTSKTVVGATNYLE